MTRADVLRVMAAGALFTLLFVPLAAAAFGRWRQTPEFAPASGRLTPGRLALLSVLYLVLYMVFGYYVAWVRPEVRAFYGGADPTGFFGNLITLTREQPELYLFQLARGALWAGLAWLFVRSVVASRAEVALLAGAVLSLPIALQLLAPNPFMPAEVRIPHLFEVAISNFLFGAIAALVLLRGSPVPAVSRAEGMPPVDPRPAPDMRSHAALAHA